MASQQRRKNSNVRVRDPRAAASVHGATFCASRQNAGSYPNFKHSETRTQTPFMFISMWLKTCEVHRYRVNNKVKHDLPSLLLINSPITYSRLLPPHSANWFSFLSLRVRNSWLARPSRPPRPSRTEKAAWTNSGSACVQRAGGAGGGEGGGGGGSDWQKWGKRGWISENKLPHLASLCLKRQKLQLGRFGWRLYSYRRVLYSVIPHVLLVCLTYLWLELWMLLLPFLILVVNAGIQRRWITVDVFSRLFRTKLLELN